MLNLAENVMARMTSEASASEREQRMAKSQKAVVSPLIRRNSCAG